MPRIFLPPPVRLLLCLCITLRGLQISWVAHLQWCGWSCHRCPPDKPMRLIQKCWQQEYFFVPVADRAFSEETKKKHQPQKRMPVQIPMMLHAAICQLQPVKTEFPKSFAFRCVQFQD